MRGLIHWAATRNFTVCSDFHNREHRVGIPGSPAGWKTCPTCVGRTFLSAGSGDFPVARFFGPPGKREHRTGKSGEPAGWKACPTPGAKLAPAFTLIELLIVIAIIAVLAALMLPALATAKQRARTVNCVSNLRQTGITLQLYLADHGTFPLATTGDGLGNWQRALRTDGTNRILFCPQPVTASDQFLQYFPTNKLSCPRRPRR